MADDKRGTLSRIDLLPEEAYVFGRAAINQLVEKRRTAVDILAELNGHLERFKLQPISKSSFNRYSLHLALEGGRTIRAREAAKAFGENLSDPNQGNIGLLISEEGKTLIYEIIMRASPEGDISAKDLKELSLAYARFETGRKNNIQSEVIKKEEFAAKAAEAVNQVVKSGGISEKTAEEIKQKILGISSAP